VSDISEQKFERALKSLPQEMVKEIMRFRVFKDRCLKLFGKLIVKKYYQEKNIDFKWENWSVDPNGKPFYSELAPFNISHSGDFVSVAFSDQNIGIDIEKIAEMDVDAIASYLHPIEKKYIHDSGNSKDAFFTIWTRKEAYLKARGIGIVEGLNKENCLEPYITYEQKWFLTSLDILKDYKLALCSVAPNNKINPVQLEATVFN
jgi:4'-phosphopantetheinyl transferase